MHNPFEGVGRTIDKDRLRGRQADLDWMVDRIRARNQNVNLVGLPRIGKTSLVEVALGEIEHKPSEPTCYLYLSKYRDSQILFDDIVKATIEKWEAGGNALNRDLTRLLDKPSTDAYSAYSRCCETMMELARLGARTLWVLDEFDYVATQRFADGQDAVLRLRELLYHTRRFQVAAVVVSRRRIEHLEQRLSGVSTLHGIFVRRFLNPLLREGCDEIIRRCEPRWSLSEAERDQVWFYAGGNPFLIESILFRAWGPMSLKAVEEDFVSHILTYYDVDLRSLCQELRLFEALTRVVSGPAWSVSSTEWDQLRQLGLIDRGGNPFSEHFREYLQQCSFQSSSPDLWRRVELEVRDLVEQVMITARGAQWLENAASGNKMVAQILRGAGERREKSTRSFGSAPARLIDYMYPMDLWELIQLYWNESFSKIFPLRGNSTQLGYWRERFSYFGQVRTPVAHHWDNVLPKATQLAATAACEEILEAISADRARRANA